MTASHPAGQVAQALHLLKLSRAHGAAPAVAVGAATVAASSLPSCGREAIEQILGPGAHSGDAAELVDVVVHACRVDPDMDVAARAAGRARSLCLQNLTHTFELRPGLRRVLQDRTDHLAGYRRIVLHCPFPRNAAA